MLPDRTAKNWENTDAYVRPVFCDGREAIVLTNMPMSCVSTMPACASMVMTCERRSFKTGAGAERGGCAGMPYLGVR